MVSIIIVNYNTFQITCNCINSIIRFTQSISYEIIVVDNASPNDNPDDFLLHFPFIKLIKNTKNEGFAKGNNLGIEQSTGDIILLLNSDTLLIEDSISISANYLTTHKKIGALSVRLIYPDGKLQHTARKFRSIKNEFLDLFRPVLKILPYRKRAQLMLNQYFRGDFDTYANWVSGAYFMFSREILDKLEGKKLDERFFMYGEDQLWCYQFGLLGYHNFFLSSTTVVHIHNASTKADKQLQLLKKILDLELYLVTLRKGKGMYYCFFSIIFIFKEKMRYYIKIIALRLLGKQIR